MADTVNRIDTLRQDRVAQTSGIVTILGIGLDLISVSGAANTPSFGLAHFLTGDYLAGICWGGAEFGLLGIEKHLEKRAQNSQNIRDYSRQTTNSRWYKNQFFTDEANRYSALYNLNFQLLAFCRNADIFTAYRDMHLKLQHPRVQMTGEGVPELLASPFKLKHLTNPWVFTPALALGLGLWFMGDHLKPIGSADKITVIDRIYSPGKAVLVSQGIAVAKYNLVAAGEEMLYRGVLLTQLEETSGVNTALILSSVIFGLMHIPQNGVGAGVGAAVGGLYMGYRYQKSSYDLGETIAAHFWIDWLQSFVSMIRNPREVSYVYSIAWKL